MQQNEKKRERAYVLSFLMMFLPCKNDVIRTALMMVLIKIRKEAMFASMCRKAHIIRVRVIIAIGNIICPEDKHHFKKALHQSAFLISSAYKPGSVVNGHQSALYVTAELQNKVLCHPQDVPDKPCVGVASNRVYSGPMLP